MRNAGSHPDRDAIIHWVAGEEPYRWTFSTLVSTAEKFGVALQENGIRKGEVCALIIRHNKLFYPIYMAVSSLGAIPAVLAYPNPRLHPDKFRQGISGMSQRSGLDWVLTERSLEPMLSPVVAEEKSTVKGVLFPLEWAGQPAADERVLEEIRRHRESIKPTDPFLLQHSSGTTGLQKPVVLSHKEVLDHVSNYSEAIHLGDDDKIVSWLPLYHDMGLIAAYHLPLAYGIPMVQIDPFEWVLAPSLLLEAISKEKGTICWVPNFAYNMMADKINEDELEGISLESLRMSVNCSEPVRDESHAKFYNRFKDYGLREEVLATSYAMAEATFAVTQSEPDELVSKLTVDRRELSRGRVVTTTNGEATRVCVSSGRPITGCEIKIVGEQGQDLAEGLIGEIAIRSVSLFDGYRNYPEKTAEVLRNGWYYSGDYGFRWEGEYYIIGRKKDIIIVAGNNVYPEDVEDAVGAAEGVIPGRVVAFGEYDDEIGSEQVSVIAESNVTDEGQRKTIRSEITRAGMQIDVTIRNVYLVPPRWLIKSSAGKPSRKANKERILSEKESSQVEVK